MKKLISELKKEMEKVDYHPNEATLYEVLEFKDDYFDFPIATGKRVLIEELRVTGNKHNGEKIDYQQKFYSGINIIIADNLKGKSSIFKIIKLAFTGKDSLKPDVSSWVNKIILGFRISDKNYAIYIDKSASRMIGSLYSTTIDNINIESTENEIFKTMTKTDYETQIEAFFFNQFSYYSLSWTQKDSAKNSIELREAKASWRTYFKSIYLESKDSISFYGNQDSKTFQILLGLKYTKIINELMIKKDFIRNTIAKKDGQKDLSITEQEHLYAELNELEKRLDSLQKNSDYMEFQTLKKLQDNLICDLQKSSMLFNSSNSQYYQILKDLDVARTVHDSLVREKEGLEKEVAKITRKTNDLREYLESGYFFSNLTIKTCPSCNHEVNLPSTSSEHHCNLCQKPVVSEKENKEQFAERINQLSEAKSTLEAKIVQIKSKISILWINIEKLEKEKLNTEKIIQNNNYDELSEKSGLVTKKLDELKNKLKENLNAEDELIAQKAVLNYRLRENSSDCNNSIDKLRQSLKILEISIDYLIEKRFQESRPILKSLEELMLNEIHAFGLTSITKIVIDKFFNIEYIQNDTKIKFDDIAEGEQLRVKLAFYLSIIQLDIQKNYGKHTRVLMIDSPAKEEGDNKYLEGLKSVLSNIEERYSDKLQILIGTAERTLIDTVSRQKIYGEGQYVF